MEKMLRDINFLKLFLSHALFLWDIRTKGFLPFLFHHLQSLRNSSSSSSSSSSSRTDVNPSCRTQNEQSPNYMVRLRREEVMMVMEGLGLIREAESEGEGLDEEIGEEEVEALFEKEPSFEELKDVFEVFDENGDGFIEAKDLQRVLKCVGMHRDVEECKRMISAFDLNGDGLINRYEFVKFMEQIFVT